MTSCYYYKVINETNKPILKNLELTVLLVMEDSERFKPDNFILNIARKTIVQYNKGYKKCPKTCGSQKIDTTWKDLNYSNLTVFNNFKKQYNNVLILEEDAEPFKNITEDDLKELNNYILNPQFIPITLGSFSFFLPTKNRHIRKSFLQDRFFGSTQAIIWNLNDIDTFSNKIIETGCSKGHWDNAYVGKLNINTFYKPIIVQKFPQTENRKLWNDPLNLMNTVIYLSDADNKTDVWGMMYFFCDNWYILIILTIILILYFINYKK